MARYSCMLTCTQHARCSGGPRPWAGTRGTDACCLPACMTCAYAGFHHASNRVHAAASTSARSKAQQPPGAVWFRSCGRAAAGQRSPASGRRSGPCAGPQSTSPPAPPRRPPGAPRLQQSGHDSPASQPAGHAPRACWQVQAPSGSSGVCGGRHGGPLLEATGSVLCSVQRCRPCAFHSNAGRGTRAPTQRQHRAGGACSPSAAVGGKGHVECSIGCMPAAMREAFARSVAAAVAGARIKRAAAPEPA